MATSSTTLGSDFDTLRKDNVPTFINQLEMRLRELPDFSESIRSGLPVPEYPVIDTEDMELDDDGNATNEFRFPHQANGDLSATGIKAHLDAKTERRQKRDKRQNETRPKAMAILLDIKYFPLHLQSMYYNSNTVEWNLGITSRDPLTLVNVIRAHSNQSNHGNAIAAVRDLFECHVKVITGATKAQNEQLLAEYLMDNDRLGRILTDILSERVGAHVGMINPVKLINIILLMNLDDFIDAEGINRCTAREETGIHPDRSLVVRDITNGRANKTEDATLRDNAAIAALRAQKADIATGLALLAGGVTTKTAVTCPGPSHGKRPKDCTGKYEPGVIKLGGSKSFTIKRCKVCHQVDKIARDAKANTAVTEITPPVPATPVVVTSSLGAEIAASLLAGLNTKTHSTYSAPGAFSSYFTSSSPATSPPSLTVESLIALLTGKQPTPIIPSARLTLSQLLH